MIDIVKAQTILMIQMFLTDIPLTLSSLFLIQTLTDYIIVNLTHKACNSMKCVPSWDAFLLLSSLTDHKVSLSAAAGIGVTSQEGQQIPSLLNQNFLNLMGPNDLCFRYPVGQCPPQVRDDNLVTGFQLGNVAEIGSAAPSSVACNDSVGIVTADGDAGL